MAEKQILFRADEKQIETFDAAIKRKGYATRNAWFKDQIARVASASKAGKAAAKAAKKRTAKRPAKKGARKTAKKTTKTRK